MDIFQNHTMYDCTSTAHVHLFKGSKLGCHTGLNSKILALLTPQLLSNLSINKVYCTIYKLMALLLKWVVDFPIFSKESEEQPSGVAGQDHNSNFC